MTSAPAERARRAACALYRLAPVWVKTSSTPPAPGSGPSVAASADCAAAASSPAARSSVAAWAAACQLVPVPMASTRRPRSRPATAAAGASSCRSPASASAWPSIVCRIALTAMVSSSLSQPRMSAKRWWRQYQCFARAARRQSQSNLRALG